ncbi:unnamed protein product [Chironomus riparius]|uniref:Amine oxidase domain-containing protein n=1 Tax=Chironomus riparius TaxID=315576 RepID=A0A9N9RRN3_9DIPT|nr:unnamed protein product [Chironomus riparius]
MTKEMNASTQSTGEFFEERYFKAIRTPEFSDIDDELRDMFLSLWHRQTNAIYAAQSWYDLSAQGFASNILCEGRQDLTWRTFGYKTLFDLVLKKFSGSEEHPINLKNRIKLNIKVTNINWKSNKVFIHTADKSVFQADHVIVTIPLGILQVNHKSLFTPTLPDIKVSAIENMKVGTLNKIFLEFEEPFWTKDFKLSAFMWTKEDLEEIIGTDKEWLQNIYGFLYIDGFPNLLETVLSGNKTKEFESYSDAKVESDCMWLLEKFLKRKLPRPSAMRRTRWSSRENFLGSYAYLSMQTTANNISPSDLAKSICNADGKPVLLFAGEATCPNYQGYVHGAFDSAKRAAQEIIDFYSKVIGISQINKL